MLFIHLLLITLINGETFLRDFLEILKRRLSAVSNEEICLQDFVAILKRYSFDSDVLDIFKYVITYRCDARRGVMPVAV